MAHILKNNNIEVHIDLPSENYHFSRFDWTGKIVAIKFRGKYVSGQEMPEQNDILIHGKGFYNEFGITIPVGFEDIKKGDWFHKIGIGILQKEDIEYNFLEPHKIRPATFEVIAKPGSLLIKCISESVNGYSYYLEKEIRLLKSGFTVGYYLDNRGEKSIITNEYNHNFLAIDKALMGKDYVLTFPFHINPALFEENVNSEGLITIKEHEIGFLGTPEHPFFFSNLSGGKLVDATWKLENRQSKIGISATGNFQTNAINLWGWGHVISPELFINLNIPAGQAKQWTRTYDMYETVS